MNNQSSLSAASGINNVYGNFVFDTIVYADPAAPGQVTLLSGNFNMQP
jgi:hypothetical protein